MNKEQKTKSHRVIPTVSHWSKVWFPGCGVCKCSHNKIVRLREDTKDMLRGCNRFDIFSYDMFSCRSAYNKHVAYKSQYDKSTTPPTGGLI